MSDDLGTTAHVTDGELATYLDGRLDVFARDRVEGHLADCADCRSVLVEARSLLEPPGIRSVPSQRARGPRPLAWLAAAGIVAIAALPVMRQLIGSNAVPHAERTAPRTRTTIEVLSPPHQRVDVTAVVFVWRPVVGDRKSVV